MNKTSKFQHNSSQKLTGQYFSFYENTHIHMQTHTEWASERERDTKTKVAKTILNNKGTAEDIIPDLKLYYIAILMKTAFCFSWRSQIHTGKQTVFSANSSGQTRRLHVEEWKFIFITLQKPMVRGIYLNEIFWGIYFGPVTNS